MSWNERPRCAIAAIVAAVWLAPSAAVLAAGDTAVERVDPAVNEADEAVAEPENAPDPPAVLVPVDLGIIPRLSVNRLYGERTHNWLSLSLLGGGGSYVTGLQLSPGVSGVGEDLRGLQVAGLVSGAGSDMTGIQIAGLISGAGGGARGVQIAGLVSGAGDGVSGLQVAGLVSGAGGRAEGAQVAGLIAGAESFSGAQLAGLIAGAGEGSGVQIALGMAGMGRGRGLQISPVSTYVEDRFTGGQLSLVNIGGDITGMQLGLINVADRLRGLQVGLINVSRSVDGASLGAVSLVDGGRREAEVWTSPHAPLSAAWRTGTERVYTMLLAGAQPGSDVPRVSAGAGVGVHLPIASSLAFEPDLLWQYVVYDYEPGGDDAMLGELRGKLAYRLPGGVAVFAGASLALALTDGTDGSELSSGADHQLSGDGDGATVVWPTAFAGVRL